MSEQKNFWDINAGRYDRFMRKDRAAYEEMYELIRPVVKAKTVLELATGTGLIAKNIVNAAAHIEATDASAEMITEAKRDNQSAKLHFSVQDTLSSIIIITRQSFIQSSNAIAFIFFSSHAELLSSIPIHSLRSQNITSVKCLGGDVFPSFTSVE